MLISTAAAMAAAFVQPVQAKDKDKGKGDKGEGGAKVEMKAPKAPKEMKSQSFAAKDFDRKMPKKESREVFTSKSKPPSVAFGGSSPKKVDREVKFRDDNRRFEGSRTQTFSRSDFRRSRPPEEVYRNWDRRHHHVWNNNRYRWYDNAWVIIGGGSPYYYDTAPYYESTLAADFDSDDLASEVQEALARRGYHPGSIDGVIGPQTRNAIAAFQDDHGLPVTGRIDRALLRALDI